MELHVKVTFSFLTRKTIPIFTMSTKYPFFYVRTQLTEQVPGEVAQSRPSASRVVFVEVWMRTFLLESPAKEKDK